MDLVIISLLIATTIITVVADILIKNSAIQNNLYSWQFILSIAIYGLTAFGWFFVMRKEKLSTLGVFYSITTVITLILIGVFFFKEKISSLEIIGIVLAIASLIILSRFS